jgi:hypothetical protein
MRGQGAGVMMVVLSAIFAAVGISVLAGVNTTGWAAINTTIFGNLGTFILLGVLGMAAFAYRYK